jgi:glycosyl transferase family 25
MNAFFDKIYVLSLKRSTDRRNTISERLKNQGIEFEFFDACDGSVMFNIWKKLDNSNFKTPNYLACSISHLSIYNDALSHKYQRILILEDDVRTHINLNDIFNSYKDQIPSDYDILYFGYVPLSDDCDIWDYRIIDDRLISSNIFQAKNLWGLYAYSISPKMMYEIIDIYNRDFPMELDRYYVNHIQQTRNCYGIYPQLFSLDMNVSENEGLVDAHAISKSIDRRIKLIEEYV